MAQLFSPEAVLSDYDLTMGPDGSMTVEQPVVDVAREYIEGGGKFTVITGRRLGSAKPILKCIGVELAFAEGGALPVIRQESGDYARVEITPNEIYDNKLQDSHLSDLKLAASTLVDGLYTGDVTEKVFSSEMPFLQVPVRGLGCWSARNIRGEELAMQVAESLREKVDGITVNMLIAHGHKNASAEQRLHNIQVVNKRANKRNAAKLFLALESVNPRKAAAIGDGANDIDMMKAVGLPVAVANAVPSLKRYVQLKAGIILPGESSEGFVSWMQDVNKSIQMTTRLEAA
jgi:HAD superfamily hydrolase (TIGR01484 family)